MQSWRTLRGTGGALSSPVHASRQEGDPPETEQPGPRWPAAALVVLVVVAVAARFVASLGLDTPWIAPDEMVYALLGRSFWQTGHLQLLNGETSSFGVYPILAGAPLAAFGPGTGMVAVKALQAVFVAVPIITVYVWTRGLARDGWALAAAAMTAALPAFVYSGLLMTEVTFLAVSTVLLWRVWRMLLIPTGRNQLLVLGLTGLAVAIRLKAVVLVPAIVLSILLMAWLVRERGLLRQFRPTALVLVGCALLGAVGASATGRALLGPYRDAVGNGYDVVSALHWTAYEAGDLLLLVFGIPVVALAALTVGAVQRRDDSGINALVAVTLPYTALLVVEVGTYVSRYETRINERTLISLAPPFFVALAAWLDRGLRRGRAVAIAAIAIGGAACLWPVDKLVVSGIVPDSFTPVPLYDLSLHASGQTVRLVWICGVAAAILLSLLLPRRGAVLLAVLVVAGLLTASILAEAAVRSRAASDRRMFFGVASPSWVDAAAPGRVAYLDDDPLWAGSWHLAYWNPKIALVSVLDSTPSGVRPDNATAFPQSDGEMLDQNAEPLPQRVVLAPSTMTLVGRRLAHAVQGGDEPGLTLWSTPAAPRLQTWTHGVLPDPVTVDVYRCTGALEFTVAARSGRPDVLISVGNLAPAILALPPGRRVRLHVPATPLITSYACRYTIRTDGDVMVTGLRFKRANVPPGQAGPTTKVARVGSTPVPGYTPSTTPLARPKLAYCVDGDFQMLPAANRPGATQAVVVEGTGLTCSVPEGYVQQGYASDGVPPGIYPLYVPPAG